MTRRLPRWSELRPLLNLQRPEPSPTNRRLARAATVPDLARVARKRVPRSVFDYVAGAAEDEISLHRMRVGFRDVTFCPRVLRDVGTIDLRRPLLGEQSALPIVLAPTGFTRMMHHQGELAVARAAARAGLPYALSTMGTTSIEALAEAVPAARRWFQLYLWRDRASGADLVGRAADAGYDTLVLTVDTPVAGARHRDARNGLTIPPSLTARTVADMARRPSWWANLLTTEPLRFASLTDRPGSLADLVRSMFDPTATIDDLAWLREQWPGSLVVKGIQHVEDARAVVDAGVDAVVLSCHGGRQLDRAPTPLQLLAPTVAALDGRAEVYVDGGVLSGADVVAAVAHGATGVLIGRAYLYGLMAGGERGVDRALEILGAEVRRTMELLGVRSWDELGPEYVELAQSTWTSRR